MRTLKLFRWVIETRAHRTRFIGLGIEIDPAVGGVGFLFCLPLIDVSFDVWSLGHLQKAAEQLAELVNAEKPDWSIYAPAKQKH